MSHCRVFVSYPADRQDVHLIIDAVAHPHPGVSYSEPQRGNDQRIGACWFTALSFANLDGGLTDLTAAGAAEFIQKLSRRFRTDKCEPFKYEIKADILLLAEKLPSSAP